MSLAIGVTLTSGQKSWSSTIDNMEGMMRRSKLDTLNAFKAAFQKAVFQALSVIEGENLPKVAMDTGLMRAAFMNAFESNFDMSLNRETAQAEFTFNTSRFISDLAYSKYHLVQSGAFKFPSGYRMPTTPDTSPIDLVLFDDIAYLLREELIRNMRLWGFDL